MTHDGDGPVRGWEHDVAGGGRLAWLVLRHAAPFADAAACDALAACLAGWRAAGGVRVAVLEFVGEPGRVAIGAHEADASRARALASLAWTLHGLRMPVIGITRGEVAGAALGLFAGCSHRIVVEGSWLSIADRAAGGLPSAGSSFFLHHMPSGAGRYVALTDLALNEADGVYAGLADAFSAEELVEDMPQALIDIAWSSDPTEARQAATRWTWSWHRRCRAGLPSSPLEQYADAIRFIAAQPRLGSLSAALEAAAREDPWFRPAVDALAGTPAARIAAIDRLLARSRFASLHEVLALETQAVG